MPRATEIIEVEVRVITSNATLFHSHTYRTSDASSHLSMSSWQLKISDTGVAAEERNYQKSLINNVLASE